MGSQHSWSCGEPWAGHPASSPGHLQPCCCHLPRVTRKNGKPRAAGDTCLGPGQCCHRGTSPAASRQQQQKNFLQPVEKVHKILRISFLLEIFHHGSAISGRDTAGKGCGLGSWHGGRGWRVRAAGGSGAKPERAGTARSLSRLPVWRDPLFGTAHHLAWPVVRHGLGAGPAHTLAQPVAWHDPWFGTAHGAGMPHNLAQPRVWPCGALCHATQCHLVAEAAPVPPVPTVPCHCAQPAVLLMPTSRGEGALQPEHPHRLHLLPATSPRGRKRRVKSSSQTTFPPGLFAVLQLPREG